MSFTQDELLRALDVVYQEDFDEGGLKEELASEYYTPGSIVSWSELGYQAEGDGVPIVVNGQEYTIKTVAETGGMDEGSHASYTFKVGDRYFIKTGYYQSHYGYDWDGDFFEVEPYEKTVTDYRRV